MFGHEHARDPRAKAVAVGARFRAIQCIHHTPHFATFPLATGVCPEHSLDTYVVHVHDAAVAWSRDVNVILRIIFSRCGCLGLW